jgi:hypothetical protein
MMGHKDKLRNGFEVDATSTYWKTAFHWKAGARVQAKKAINKRGRKAARLAALAEMAEAM